MYRWDNRTELDAEDFNVHGPFSEDKNFKLMERAVTSRQKWLLVVTAYFLDGDDYYEEVLTFPPFGPLRFNDEPEAILEVVKAAVAEAKDSGDASHYRDTCIALYPHSPTLEVGFEDPEQTKARAALRAGVMNQIAHGGLP